MRIPRFYFPQPLQTGQTVELPPEVFRHAIQVLRLGTGEELILFNGEGGEYTATLETVGKRSASACIGQFSAEGTESPARIILALTVIKSDKMDFALQKAVELGVSAIQPLVTQRSVIRLGKEKADKKLRHWEGVLTAACEQSGRTRIPAVAEPLRLSDWLQQAGTGTCLILAPGNYPRINTLPTDLPQPLTLVIGPEGGFTDEEVDLCLQSGVTAVSLGPRILRAETAALTALALLQHHYGDI